MLHKHVFVSWNTTTCKTSNQVGAGVTYIFDGIRGTFRIIISENILFFNFYLPVSVSSVNGDLSLRNRDSVIVLYKY